MAPKQDSIIEIIQKMVRDGESRDKIVQTLIDLGVSEEQAKRLLLIAEADTFTLLKKEINSLVKGEMDSQRRDFEEIIHEDIAKAERDEREKVAEVAKVELKDVEKEIINKTKEFEGRVDKTIGSSEKTVNMVKMAIDSIQNRLSQLEIDLEQIKIHRYRRGGKVISYTLMILGALTLFSSVALLYFNFYALDSAQMMMIAVLMLASLALVFASIIS
jgi:hypothetical protein